MNQNGTPASAQPGTDQRAFIETSELVRNSMLTQGYTVGRIYTKTVDGGGYCLVDPGSGPCPPGQMQQPYNGDSTPRRYFNGTLLPADLGGGSGSTANIVNAINNGRFLVLHRDHGWEGGWSNPGFATGNANGLTNGGLLPVVFSVNCASGLFDNETAGAQITALQHLRDGSARPIGRGLVINGVADLFYFVQPDPLGPPPVFSASLDNSVSVVLGSSPTAVGLASFSDVAGEQGLGLLAAATGSMLFVFGGVVLWVRKKRN
ncbi:MAG: C25 family cysteine peptidase [Dehalococcoidia bacterium]|nr:C25 family cysteine peptidase [Dehalococcoidia bacterium]